LGCDNETLAVSRHDFSSQMLSISLLFLLNQWNRLQQQNRIVVPLGKRFKVHKRNLLEGAGKLQIQAIFI